eukprot:TRINITY_DN3485_c0_g1_i1.p1 TRINITY_DN3485_c0_g1~~TRINITY_DN3485_c0_g1_i1.p1  ORF type:complete len:211 (+),score=35.95 TRINITY_DN3485_c0_g1_i1:75-707(+)
MATEPSPRGSGAGAPPSCSAAPPSQVRSGGGSQGAAVRGSTTPQLERAETPPGAAAAAGGVIAPHPPAGPVGAFLFRERGGSPGRGAPGSPARARSTSPFSPVCRGAQSRGAAALPEPQLQPSTAEMFQPLCMYYLTAVCKWGQSCRNAHIAPAVLERFTCPSAAAAPPAAPALSDTDMQSIQRTAEELIDAVLHPEHGYSNSAHSVFRL